MFNNYFTGKSNVINPNDKPPDLKKIFTNDVFDTLDTTHWELGPIIKSLKSSNHSPCGIPATFIKDAYKNRFKDYIPGQHKTGAHSTVVLVLLVLIKLALI